MDKLKENEVFAGTKTYLRQVQQRQGIKEEEELDTATERKRKEIAYVKNFSQQGFVGGRKYGLVYKGGAEQEELADMFEFTKVP